MDGLQGDRLARGAAHHGAQRVVAFRQIIHRLCHRRFQAAFPVFVKIGVAAVAVPSLAAGGGQVHRGPAVEIRAQAVGVFNQRSGVFPVRLDVGPDGCQLFISSASGLGDKFVALALQHFLFAPQTDQFEVIGAGPSCGHHALVLDADAHLAVAHHNLFDHGLAPVVDFRVVGDRGEIFRVLSQGIEAHVAVDRGAADVVRRVKADGLQGVDARRQSADFLMVVEAHDFCRRCPHFKVGVSGALCVAVGGAALADPSRHGVFAVGLYARVLDVAGSQLLTGCRPAVDCCEAHAEGVGLLIDVAQSHRVLHGVALEVGAPVFHGHRRPLSALSLALQGQLFRGVAVAVADEEGQRAVAVVEKVQSRRLHAGCPPCGRFGVGGVVGEGSAMVAIHFSGRCDAAVVVEHVVAPVVEGVDGVAFNVIALLQARQQGLQVGAGFVVAVDDRGGGAVP